MPLYTVPAWKLSIEELEIIWCIHEEGAHSCHFNRVKVLVLPVALFWAPTYSNTVLEFLVLLLRHLLWLSEPPSLVPNGGVGIHSNGHMNGAIGSPWFNHALTPQWLVELFCQLR
ncbi:hypothetical protein Vadar_030490 [Vaccinium darrowii]|uniref:Uncharacterized protein n=1 Tax=Vaccinium darrowii TaxID=229202 RepID=A0ACB7XL65_9ERIC|nr:hypothetical protein Vadar_030490 [Vaccinium darrowii]